MRSNYMSMSEKMVFVLSTGERIPADKVTPEQIRLAVALVKITPIYNDAP